MPKDKSGKFHFNTQQAMHADRSNMHKQSGEMAQGVGDPTPGGEGESEMQDDAIRTHLDNMHKSMGGAHMHVYAGEDGSIRSHHVTKDGEHEGPHDHANLDALKDHMNHFLDEERDEAYDDGEMKGEEEPAMRGM